MSEPDAFTRFCRGDRVAAEQLKRAFETIRDRSEDEEVARCARQVLDGRRSVRDVVQDPDFERAMESGLTRFAQAWDELGDEERRALLAEGERERAETARWLGTTPDAPGAPGTPVPSLGADRAVDAFLARRPAGPSAHRE